MRIRSVGHACLEITTRGLRIVSDPWWAGPAYNNQWYPWPQPRPDGLTDRAIDYLYLSHGHEDHLHLDTLGTLQQGATVLVPRFVTGRLGPFLREFGSFSEVIELDHGRSIVLRNGVRATCYINATDSLLVLEGDETVVNANDALHASPPAVIEHFCRLLRRRHPRINAMFIGYGGAAWSPNCIHVPGKDDREIARAQEGLFVQNFLRIVDRLAPQVACAFAASFVLLEPWNRWINDVKLSVPTPDVAYGHETVPGRTRCHLLLPNDVVEGGIIRPGGTPRPSIGELERAYATIFRDDCRRVENLVPLPSEELAALAQQMEQRLKANRIRMRRGFTADLEVLPRENPGMALRIAVAPRRIAVTVGATSGARPSLALRVAVLRGILDQDYGTESVFIGYGAIASLADRAQLRTVQAVIQLLSARVGGPRAIVNALGDEPAGTIRALWHQRMPLALQTALRLRLISNPTPAQTVGT